MVTIIRDRFQDAIKKRMTLEQVKAAAAARLRRPLRRREGAWTTDAFVEAAYRSLSDAGRRRVDEVIDWHRGVAERSRLLVLGASQSRRSAGAAPVRRPPPPPQAPAPIDLTGYWVSIVNEDWRWRMVTPPKGDTPASQQLMTGRAQARRHVGAGAGRVVPGLRRAGLMRMPTRLHIAWENDSTLKIDTDAGSRRGG